MNLNKTAVTELKITLADLHTRTRVCKAAGAVVLTDRGLIQGDIVLSPSTPVVLNTITNTLTIVCNEPIEMRVYDENMLVVLSIIIHNQFSLNGSISNMVELNAVGTNSVRVQYLLN